MWTHIQASNKSMTPYLELEGNQILFVKDATKFLFIPLYKELEVN
jgi:hypothetical protein